MVAPRPRLAPRAIFMAQYRKAWSYPNATSPVQRIGVVDRALRKVEEAVDRATRNGLACTEVQLHVAAEDAPDAD